MKLKLIICTMALMILSMPILALQGTGPGDVYDLGAISNQTLNLSQNSTLTYPGDIGWFMFQVTEPVNFVFSVDRYDEQYAYVIYDEDMEYLDSGESVLMVSLNPGSYYLRIEAIPFKSVNYTLKGSAVRNETEPNDGIGDAMDIGSIVGPILIAGEIDSGADTDFFKFRIDEGMEGLFEANTMPSSMVLLALYKFNNSKNHYEIIDSETGSISKYLTAGKYVLRLGLDTSELYYYDSDTNAKYILDLNLSSIESTPLGILNRSAPLEVSGYLESSNLKDYYSFEAEETSPVRIETSGERGDSTLRLENEDHETLAYNDDYTGRWSQIEQDLESGKYFVVVGSYSGELSYNMKIEMEGEQ